MSTLILALALAVVYLTGYSYLDGFYGFYDVPLSQLNFGIQFIAAHAFIPFKHFFSLPLVATALVTFFTTVLFVHVLRTKALVTLGFWGYKNIFISSVLNVFIWSMLVMTQAPQIGYSAARDDFQSLNRAALGDGSGARDIQALLERLEGSSLHYLVSANDNHIFVIKFSGSERRWTQHVPKDSLNGFRVYQNADGSALPSR